MNKYWRPDDRDENSRTWDDLHGTETDNPVSRASLVRFLGMYGRNYNLQEIFKLKKPAYITHNEVMNKFKHSIVTREEAEALITNCASYTSGCMLYCWKYTVTVADKRGNTYTKLVNQIKKNAPFCKSDGANIRLHRCKAEISQILQEFGNGNEKSQGDVASLLKKSGDLTLNEFKTKAEQIMGERIPPKKLFSGKLFEQLHRDMKVPRFYEVDFLPFLGLKNPAPKEVLNTFMGFPLERYKATEKIDVTKTLIFTYLCNVFGWSEQYNSRVGELLDGLRGSCRTRRSARRK